MPHESFNWIEQICLHSVLNLEKIESVALKWNHIELLWDNLTRFIIVEKPFLFVTYRNIYFVGISILLLLYIWSQ